MFGPLQRLDFGRRLPNFGLCLQRARHYPSRVSSMILGWMDVCVDALICVNERFRLQHRQPDSAVSYPRAAGTRPSGPVAPGVVEDLRRSRSGLLRIDDSVDVPNRRQVVPERRGFMAATVRGDMGADADHAQRRFTV